MASCQSTLLPTDALSLSDVNSDPIQFRDKEVKICGFATKQFENVQITEPRNGSWREENVAGLSVKWLDKEPYTEGPEWRCITGLIEPTCGWENGVPSDENDIICLSTASVYQWSIRQTQLGRN